jgi:hypothetical protein
MIPVKSLLKSRRTLPHRIGNSIFIYSSMNCKLLVSYHLICLSGLPIVPDALLLAKTQRTFPQSAPNNSVCWFG